MTHSSVITLDVVNAKWHIYLVCNMASFLLLWELAGNALCRILVAMAEISFGKPTGSSRRAHGKLWSIYVCILSSPTEGRPSKVQISASHSLKKVQTTVDGNRSTAPACFHPQNPSWVRWALWNHIWPSSSKHAGSNTQMGLRSSPLSCMNTSSQIPISSIVILGWRKLRKCTKQLCLIGEHFHYGTRGCAHNSKLRP